MTAQIIHYLIIVLLAGHKFHSRQTVTQCKQIHNNEGINREAIGAEVVNSVKASYSVSDMLLLRCTSLECHA